ncbi:protein kinase domain-containing protein [Actinomadura scrupuli]|uniref:serine/threonine-protein kinase n=1 Tax=Actinomadura scrupuli TaxID=559629 RepID=UPI003D95FA46
MDLPGYEIADLLGQGGFGTVYRARQLAVQRAVALKIDSRVLATERDRRRFMREVTAAGQLSGHPHVVALYDAGLLADGRPYLVLELCPNGSLGDRLHDKGPFPPEEVRDIGVRIADAVAAAHAAGVLHRDIKPGNILVNQYGGVALADFGLAAMPQPGLESSATREALTPAYAPPEAFRLEEPSPAGDVYSLGATLYALLSGRPPHFPPDRQPSIHALMAAHLRPVPDLPGVPPALTAVLRQSMAYDPAARQPSAAALRDALAAADLSPADRGRSAYAGPVPPGAPQPSPYDSPPVAAGAPGSMPSEPTWSESSGSGPGSGAGFGSGPGFGAASAGSQTGSAERTIPPRPGKPPGSGGSHRTVSASESRRGVSRGVVYGAAALIAIAIVGTGALVALSGGDPGHGPTGGGSAAGSPGGAAAAGANAYGGAQTVTENCPAATVPGGRARCVKTAECWGGMVVEFGSARAGRVDCTLAHTWETFAIAPLPADAQTWNQDDVSHNPTVRKICARAVVSRSLTGKAVRYRAAGWQIDVLPPTQAQYDQGARTFRCVAGLGLDRLRGTAFRPRV